MPQSSVENHEFTVLTQADDHIPSRNEASSLLEPYTTLTGCTWCSESSGASEVARKSPVTGSGSSHMIPSMKIRSLFLRKKKKKIQTWKIYREVNDYDPRNGTLNGLSEVYI